MSIVSKYYDDLCQIVLTYLLTLVKSILSFNSDMTVSKDYLNSINIKY